VRIRQSVLSVGGGRRPDQLRPVRRVCVNARQESASHSLACCCRLSIACTYPSRESGKP
jgi:hypothetical protein